MTLHTLANWNGSPSYASKKRGRFGLYDDFDRLVNGLFDNFLEVAPTKSKAGGNFDFTPSMNVEDTEEAYKLTVEVPGSKREDLSLEVVDNQLIISGEKKQDYDEKKADSHIIGRSYGRFERRINLGQDVDSDKIDAEVKDGLLTVILPKLKEAKNRVKKLEIK